MLTLDCKVVWYGKLKIDSKVIPVIYDPLILPSIKGCIYLYNSERDAIVQYAWNIVKDLLVDVDKVEKSTLKKAIDAKWKAARKKFTKGTGIRLYVAAEGVDSRAAARICCQTLGLPAMTTVSN